MRPLTILVVDDDAPTRDVLELWLEAREHRVLSCAGGREALAILDREPIEFLITDVLMPDGDGIQLIAAMRRKRPGLRILAITGGGVQATSSTCLERAQKAGAHALLLKPFSADHLLEAMRFVMGAAEAEPPEGRGKQRQSGESTAGALRLFSGLASDSGELMGIRSREKI